MAAGVWRMRRIVGPHGCDLWKGIMKGWDVFAHHIDFIVGEGNRVRLWHDRWCGDIVLKDAFPTLFACTSHQDITIDSCFITQGETLHQTWDVAFNRNFNDWELETMVDFLNFLNSHLPGREGEAELRWKWKSSGIFYTKSYYNVLRSNMASKTFPWKSIWGAKAPKRVNFFIWTSAWGKILTNDNLMRQEYVMVNWYCMCQGHCETMDHILLHCPKTVRLCHYVVCSFGVQWVLPATVMDLLFSWRNWLGKHSSSIWNLVPACLLWTIWKERNCRIFDYLESSDGQILVAILRS